MQSNVARVETERGEKRLLVIKLDVFQKIHKRKWVLINLPVVTFGTLSFIRRGATLNKKDFTNPAMEAEFGVILNRDIKPELVSFDYILDSIKGIYPLIEIHNLIFPWRRTIWL